MVFERVAIGVCLLGVTLFIFMVGGWLFAFVLAVVMTLAIREWTKIALGKTNGLFFALFLLYLLFAFGSILWLRLWGQEGTLLMMWLLAVVVTFDSCAWAFGRRFGMIKLMPSISPHKTMEGLMGGMGGAILMSEAFNLYSHYLLFVIGACVAGDLLESYAKRCCGVKDSSNLLGAHGGVLDRTDSFLASAVMMAVLIYGGY